MYSFEGKFRTTPNVSLGGKRKQDKIDKNKLLLKAQLEREKREEIRRRLRSAVVIQASVRSFLTRQHLKQQLRLEFDSSRSQVTASQQNVDRLTFLSKRLKFFYNPKTDNERLASLGQQILKDRTAWVTEDGNSLFCTLGILKLVCRCLASVDATSSFAIPLRILETFTDDNFLKKTLRWNEDDARYFMLKFWENFVKFEFFKSIIHILSEKVEPLAILEDNVRPMTPLADTLISLLVRPVIIAAKTEDEYSRADEDKMAVSEPEVSRLQNKIVESFIHEVFLPHPTQQLYYIVYPVLGDMTHFPVEPLVMFALRAVEGESSSRPWILGSLAKVIHQKLEYISDSCFSAYLHCMKHLLPQLPQHCVDESDSDGDDSDEDEEILDDELADKKMIISTTQAKINLTAEDVLINDSLQVPTSKPFISSLVDRKIYESEANLDAICAICYHLITVKRVNIQKNRFLQTLAFSSSFLRKLWNSTITSSTASKITGKSIPLVQLLIEVSPMTPAETSLIWSKLIVFCALFNLHLLAVPDTDFYSSDIAVMTSPTSTLVSIAMLMRDVCLSMIKRALPETGSRLGKFEMKSVINALSTGRSLKKHSRSKEEELEIKRINESVCLFCACRRLVKHLHTRDSRGSFISKGAWLSNTIKMEQSRHLANRWHRRSAQSNSVAAHLVNATEEDAVLSVAEARQLAVLVNMPFVVPFDARVSIFMTMLNQDRQSRESDRQRAIIEAGLGPSTMTNEIKVRRDFVYEDAFNDLSPENAPNLRKRLRVHFVNSMGLEEAGYGEGVTREFMQQLVKAGFNPTRGLFKSTAQGRLYPNPHASLITENSKDHFYFLGRMLGKVLYEGMQVELPFASFFLCKILQRKSSDVDINHLQSLDPDFYKNLMYLHEYKGDVSDLALNFTVVDELLGVTRVTELVRDGKNTMVTNNNKDMYMHLMANYKLNVQMRESCFHFRRGLEDVVSVDWLQMFDHEEFQILVAGAEVPIDIEDLKANTVYSSGYSAEHPTIQAFWDVLPQLTNEQLSQLMLFVSSCSRPPLLGFKELDPPFCIQRGGAEDRLPSASTCLNLLKLPEYADAETLKAKLLYCLQSQSGFELS